MSCLRVLFLGLSLLFMPGCGLLFQLYAGYDEHEARLENTTHTLSIDSLPRGATVKELDGGQEVHLGNTPLDKQIEFVREVTITKPAPMAPYWIGTSIDAALIITGGIVLGTVIAPDIDRRLDRASLWLAFAQLPLYWIGEVVVGAIVGNRDPVVSKRVDRPVSYALLLQKAGRPEVEARLEIPTFGTRLVVPLDEKEAARLDRKNLMLIVTPTSTTTSTTN